MPTKSLRSEKMPHDLRLWGASPETVCCYDRFDTNLYFNAGGNVQGVIVYNLRRLDNHHLLYHQTVRHEMRFKHTKTPGVFRAVTPKFEIPILLQEVLELHQFWFSFMAVRNYLITHTEFNRYYIAFYDSAFGLDGVDMDNVDIRTRYCTRLYRLGIQGE